MKSVAITTFCAILLFVGTATATFASEIDNTFDSEQFRDMFSKRRAFSAEFSQERKIAILSKPLISQGQLDFSPAKGLRWRVTSPIEHTLIMRGDQINQYGRACSKIPPQAGAWQAEFVKIFSALVKADLKALQPYFDISIGGSPANWNAQLVAIHIDLRRALGTVTLFGIADEIQRVQLQQGSDTTTMKFATSPSIKTSKEDNQEFDCQ